MDSGATNHLTFTIQGFISRRRPSKDEKYLFMGNNMKVDVEFIGDVILHLDSGFRMTLYNAFYVPFFKRNLVLVSIQDNLRYSFELKNSIVNVSSSSDLVGHFILTNGLYKLCLSLHEIYTTINVECNVPKKVMSKERSYTLWRKRLCHIFRERIIR